MILALIGVKLVLHWAHGVWPSVPQIPPPISLVVTLLILATVTITSLRTRHSASDSADHPHG